MLQDSVFIFCLCRGLAAGGGELSLAAPVSHSALRSGERNESSSLPPILYFAWQRYFNTNVLMNLKD